MKVDNKQERWYDQVMFYAFWIYVDELKLMWWQLQEAFREKFDN